MVTDGSGKATLIYTAPAAPAFAVDSGTVVQIRGDADRDGFRQLDVPRRQHPPRSTERCHSAGRLEAGVHGQPADRRPTTRSLLFDASSSQPTTGQNAIVNYDWDFGDGGHSSGVTTQHTYNNPGTYFPRLTVSDAFGRQASAAAATNAASGVISQPG